MLAVVFGLVRRLQIGSITRAFNRRSSCVRGLDPPS